MSTLFQLLIFLATLPSVNAQGERESLFSPDEFYENKSPPSQKQIDEVNRLYNKNVKSIFQRKCLDCHGKLDSYPWYYSIPGVQQLIDYDMSEAKKHIDMSHGYPFKGHGDPKSDLEAIRDVIEGRSMPPFRYWIVNWGSSLNSNDEEIILRWIEQSLTIMASDE